MVDTTDLKSVDLTVVPVRVRPAALFQMQRLRVLKCLIIVSFWKSAMPIMCHFLKVIGRAVDWLGFLKGFIKMRVILIR